MESSDSLISPHLGEALLAYVSHEGELWENFLDTEPESLDELAAAGDLARYYIVKTAAKLAHEDRGQHGTDRRLWSERFTMASEEFYGAPEREAAANIASWQRSWFREHDSKYARRALSLLEELGVSQVEAPDKSELLDENRREALAAIILDSIEPAITHLKEHSEEAPFDAEQTLKLIQEGLEKMADQDDGWTGWKADFDDSASLSVVGLEKTVFVGEKKLPTSFEKSLGLIVHEVGIHAQRRVNGTKTKIPGLDEGLPGYLDFEEGLGIFVEYLISGEVPDRAQDRYLDVSLALGQLGDRTATREELIELAANRQLARLQVAGRAIDEKAVEDAYKGAKTHVNRMFRGGDGKSYDGVQAIYTKDQIYYKGLLSVLQYFQNGLEQSKTPQELMDWTMLGKFDPTNPDHVEHIQRHLS